jgi:hypothetical protein
MITITTSRFSNLTWSRNAEYRNKHKCCVYGSPQEFTHKILAHSLVFVVEMNNDTNQIEGIGLVRNWPCLDKYYSVYDDGNYNRYVYKSNYHIGRERLIEYNRTLVENFDQILFKGKTHLKRGTGFITVPDKLLNNPKCNGMDIKFEIKKIFVEEFNGGIDSLLLGNPLLEKLDQNI